MAITKMPEEFLWGGATAANQYEGGWDEGGAAPPSPTSSPAAASTRSAV